MNDKLVDNVRTRGERGPSRSDLPRPLPVAAPHTRAAIFLVSHRDGLHPTRRSARVDQPAGFRYVLAGGTDIDMPGGRIGGLYLIEEPDEAEYTRVTKRLGAAVRQGVPTEL